MSMKILYGANIFGLALFLGLAFLLPIHGESQAAARYDEVRKREPLYATQSTNMTTAPEAAWIADPAISGARFAANIGIALTLLNVSIFFATSTLQKKKKN